MRGVVSFSWFAPKFLIRHIAHLPSVNVGESVGGRRTNCSPTQIIERISGPPNGPGCNEIQTIGVTAVMLGCRNRINLSSVSQHAVAGVATGSRWTRGACLPGCIELPGILGAGETETQQIVVCPDYPCSDQVVAQDRHVKRRRDQHWHLALVMSA